jgi:hypothetical protein
MMRFFFSIFTLSLLATAVFAAEPVEFRVGAFEFSRPAGWKWIVPSSGMRKAQLEVPGGNNEKAEITFFHFGPGQGGSVDANVERWFGQFPGGRTSRSEASQGRTLVYYVQAQGTFQSGMPGGPTTPLEAYALQGAILQDAQSGDVFVKMTGPEALVQLSAPLFLDMVNQAAASRGEAP